MLMEKLRGGSVSNKLADDQSESSSLVRGGRTTRRQAGRLAEASAELLSSSTTTAVSSSQPPKNGGRTGDNNSGGGSVRSNSPSSSSPNNLKGSSNKTPGHAVVKASATKVVSPSQNTTGGKSFREIVSGSPPVCVKEEFCCSTTETLFPNTTITTTTTPANPISTSLSSAQPKWNLPVENDKTRDCNKKVTRGRGGNKQAGNKGGCKTLESKKQGALERKNRNCESGGDSVINSSGTSVSKDVSRSSSSTNYGNSGQSNVGEVCSDKSARSSFRLRGDTGRGGGGSGGGESLAWEESNFQSRPHPPPKVMTEKPRLAPMLLMNNLPYMGELTFDTRPRRGRKPKKADICHLISKNYGIQFPNSYTNSPNTGSFPVTNAVPNVSAPVPKKATKKSSAAKKSASATWRLSGGGGVALDCGLPPDLVPLSTSATVPQCSLRLSLGGSSPGGASQMNSVQSGELWGTSSKISSMYNCNNGKIRDGMPCLSSKPCKMEEEEPLNLCLRDSPSNLYNSSPPPPPSPHMNTSSPIPSQSSFKSKASVGMLQKDLSGSLSSLNVKSSLGGDSNSTSSTCDAHLVNSNVKKGEQRKNSGARGSCLNGGAQSAPASGSSNSILNQKSSPSSSSAKVKGKRKRSGGGFMPPPPPPTSSANNKFSSTPSSSTASLQDSSSKEAMEKAKAAAAYTTGNSLFGQPNSCSRAEVSICKFKFTGGAKPSLQEKKMLSVDSGGNFRFYTDKATSSSSKSFRASISSSSTRSDFDNDCQYPLSSLPKSAKSMSMCMPVPVTSMTSLSISKGETLSSFCQFPKPIETTGVASARGSSSSRVSSSSSLTSPPVSSTLPGYSKGKTKNAGRSKGGGGIGAGGAVGDVQPTTTFVSGDDSVSCSSDNSNNSNSRFSGLMAGVGNQPGETSKSGALRIRPPNTPNSNKLKLKRKRRTRKSLMREKLEKTFKEKGFLIQTQQLESAEGATYCKFRQLRKFTRYLFRSWKDYLPDNVKDIQRAPGSAPANSSPATISPAMSPTTLATHPSIGFGDGTVPQNVTQRKSGTKTERQLRNSGKFEAIEVDGDEDDGSNDEECDFDGDNEGDDCGELEQEPEDFKSEPCEEDNYLSPGDYFAHTRDESHSEDEDVDMDMDTGDHRPSIPPTSPEDDNDVDEEEDTSDSDNIDE